MCKKKKGIPVFAAVSAGSLYESIDMKILQWCLWVFILIFKGRNHILLLLSLFPLFIYGLSDSYNKQIQIAGEKINNMENVFVENKGQFKNTKGDLVPFVLFKASMDGMDVYLTENGLTYVFTETVQDIEGQNRDISVVQMPENAELKMAWLNVNLKNASIKKENIITEGPGNSYHNYFYPHCPNGIYGVKSFNRIIIKEVYSGIDWVLKTEKGGFKYDFIVHPKADASQIKLVYESERPAVTDDEGNIVVETPLAILKEKAPVCFLNGEGVKGPASKFNTVLIDEHNVEMSFDIAKYETSQTLIIDPQLWWSTFFGGTNIEYMTSAECDAAGNLFIAGHTQSADFPLLNAGTYFDNTLGTADIVIMKFTNSAVLLWSTFYGGSSTDQVFNICIDNAGNLFMNCSVQSNDMPLQNAGTYYDNTLGGVYDLVLLKFDNAGNRLWGTYFGGSAYDEGMGICDDANGNIFIVGNAQSADMPVLNSGTYFDNTKAGTYDMFIAKFDNAGNQLWTTYYGGSANETGYAVCCDPSNNIIITGSTTSADFPVLTAGTYFDNTLDAASDAFVLKFDNLGNRLWSTYYGGNADDYGNSICTNMSGDVFIVGRTTSSNFPVLTTGRYFDNTLNGTSDAFVLEFDNTGNRLWATYLGGNNTEVATSYDNIVADSCSNIFLTFGTKSTDIVTQNSCIPGFYDNSLGSTTDFDVYVAKFADRGGLLWSTYFGGDGNEALAGMAIDLHGDIFITGVWQKQLGGPFTSSTYPTVDPGGGALFSSTLNASGFSGTQDGYVCKFINKVPLSLSHAVSPASACDCSGIATLTVTGGCAPYKTNWYNNSWSLQTTNDSLLNACAGNFHVIALDTINCSKDTLDFSITADSPLSLDTSSVIQPGCVSTGSVFTTLSGGSSPYSYSWSSSHTTSSVSGLAVGSYSLVITDNKNCKDTLNVVLFNSDSITAQINGSSSICAGTITTLSAYGGTTYSWNTGSTNTTINISPSVNTTYTLISNSGICSDTTTYYVTVNTVSTNTVNPVSCNSYTLNSQVYSSSGIYTQTLTNASGCDSILTINLTISPAINTNANVNVCSGQSALIHGISQNTTGVYTQTFVAAGGCDSISTVTLTINNVLTGTINPVSCKTYTINGQNYSTTGVYTQSLTNSSGCDSILTINLTITPVITSNNNRIICSGQSANIHGINQTTTGVYTQTFVTSGGCDSIATVNLNVVNTPTLTITPLIDTIRNGSAITITANGSSSYLWDDGNTNSAVTISPVQTINYCVIGTNGNNCSDTICADIIVLNTECDKTKIFVPSGFSPNGDGQNDELTLYATGGVEAMNFVIYNRWGQVVFETTDINKKWNGIFNNKLLDATVFTYTLKYICNQENIESVISGNISLVR